MENQTLLEQNTKEVNAILRKVSIVSIIAYSVLTLIALRFHVESFMTYTSWFWSSLTNFLAYFLAVLLTRSPSFEKFSNYIFPLEMYVMIAINGYVLRFPVATYIFWLFPVVYGALYAKLRSLLIISLLTFITIPAEAYWVKHDEPGILTEVVSCSIGLLLIFVRLMTVVSRSRVLLDTTSRELKKNRKLQESNATIINEVVHSMETVREVVMYATHMADETRQAMSQIASSSQHVLTSSEDTNEVLLEHKKLVEQSFKQSELIDHNTNHVFQFATRVREEAEGGKTIVNEMANAIQELDKQSLQTVHKVQQLASRAQEIAAMSAMIQSIASNIHIIAMNTGIEAARATNGSTFRVIAQEIQKLAEQSKQTSVAINSLSKAVKEDLLTIEQTTLQNRCLIEQSVLTSHEATKKLHAIVDSVDEIQSLLREVTDETRHQQEQSHQLLDGIAQLISQSEATKANIETAATSTQQVLASVEELGANIDHLNQQSKHLTDLLAKIDSTDQSYAFQSEIQQPEQ
jgi:methyl-accepting chemotaxis protein